MTEKTMKTIKRTALLAFGLAAALSLNAAYAQSEQDGHHPANAPAEQAAPQASQPHYISGGTPTQCGGGGTGTRMVNPAFVLVAPVGARDGGGGDGGFDGANNRAFAQGNGTCVTPPDYPGDERYDDLVVAESATALLGWLMATTR